MSQKWARTSEVFHLYLFELRDGQLYFRDKSKSLTTREGKLRLVKEIKKILGDGGLRDLDFNVPKGKAAAMLNIVEEELPSASDLDEVNDIELQEIAKSKENLISKMSQTEGEETLPMQELLGLDKQLRSIRGSLKVEVAKRFSWKNTSRKSNKSSRNSETILENTTMAFEKKSPRESTS